MANRTIAVGDIHGCLAALDALVEAIDPQHDDKLVVLGDFVDRGPDSRGVIDRLIDLSHQCHLIPLLGNHDEMFLRICRGEVSLLTEWLMYGGDATVRSYGGKVPANVPDRHLQFLELCLSWYETEQHFFVHGNYWAHVPLERQPGEILRWNSLKVRQPGAHQSGKTAVVGHSAQKTGEILDLGYLKCIDTWCYGGGWLTALEVTTGFTWQANKLGRLRRRC